MPSGLKPQLPKPGRQDQGLDWMSSVGILSIKKFSCARDWARRLGLRGEGFQIQVQSLGLGGLSLFGVNTRRQRKPSGREVDIEHVCSMHRERQHDKTPNCGLQATQEEGIIRDQREYAESLADCTKSGAHRSLRSVIQCRHAQ